MSKQFSQNKINAADKAIAAIDLHALWIRYMRKWHWFALSVFIWVSLGVLYILCKNPEYKVSSTVMIRTEEGDLGSLPGMNMLQSFGLGGIGREVESEMYILNSQRLMGQVIEDLDIQTRYRKKKGLRYIEQYPSSDIRMVYPPLFTDTMFYHLRFSITKRQNDYKVRFKYGRKFSGSYSIDTLTDSICTPIGTFRFTSNCDLETGDKMKINILPVMNTIEFYREHLQASQVKKESNVLEIATISATPQKAIDMIERLVFLYNEDAVLDKELMVQGTGTFIDDRLRLISEELSTIEHDVEQYKKDNNLTNISAEVELFLASSSEYQKKAAELETQYNLIVYIEDYISNPENHATLIPANLGVDDEALIRLIENYNATVLKRMRLTRTTQENNPVIQQLDAQIAVVRNNILSSIHSLKESINISRKDVANKDNMFLKRIQSIPTQEREYIEIKRQQKIKETLYIFLYQKREENALSLINNIQPTKIIDTAACLPLPVAPRKKVLLALCMLMGLCFPLAVFFMLDLIKNKVNNISDFTREVHTPLVGHISKINSRKTNLTRVTEDFRYMRTNIDFLLSDIKSSPVLLVTSGLRHEGKSFVAKHLALSYAQAQKKVCLIDLNLRNPQISDYVATPSRYSIDDYITNNNVGIADIIQISTLHEQMHCITSRTDIRTPEEILLSAKLDTLMADLQKTYDVIILDSAPVGIVCDTFMINRLATMTLMVTRVNYTPKEGMKYINELHQNQRLNKMYCVINGVEHTTPYQSNII